MAPDLESINHYWESTTRVKWQHRHTSAAVFYEEGQYYLYCIGICKTAILHLDFLKCQGHDS